MFTRFAAVLAFITCALAAPQPAVAAVCASAVCVAHPRVAHAARCVTPAPSRRLADLGVPTYTRTNHGFRGDPVNLIVVGDERQVLRAFKAAGWIPADPITPVAAAKEVTALFNPQGSYPTQPMSDLFLFGRRQDLAFQRNNVGIRARDHLRVWRCNRFDPSGRPLWAVSATKDVGLELVGGLPMHRIGEHVDVERDYVASTLAKAVSVARAFRLTAVAGGYRSLNGDRDPYETDGLVQVLELPRRRPTLML